MIEAFPLCWPEGYPRTKHRVRAKFKATMGQSTYRLMNELRMMGVTRPVLSTNVRLRQDGLPYSGQRQPEDTGAAVYFTYKNAQRVLACDRWDKIEDNIHALELAVAAMRGLERWGVSQILERAFTGFTALPEKTTAAWWQVLFVSKEAPLPVAAYRELAKKAHPDQGGTQDRMIELNNAIQEARKRS